jgi:hypothetical protein
MSDLTDKLEANARFYEGEAAALKPNGARHLGPEESAVIAKLLRDAAEMLRTTENSEGDQCERDAGERLA